MASNVIHEYCDRVPDSIPADRVLVHNRVHPVARRNGTRGDWLPFQPAFEVFGKIASRAITRTCFALQTFRADCLQVPI